MLSEAFIQKTKARLLDEKLELTEKSTKHHDIDTDGDETDEVQGHILIEMNHHFNTRNSEKLIHINDALKRIDDKTYGFCQDCEEDIPEKRLTANPYFMTCVSCAEERELESKQRKKF
jgi:DnaK suppressor protein